MDPSQVNKDVLKLGCEWAFDKSIELKGGKTYLCFFTRSSSANGVPGIHHVMALTIKDFLPF